MSLGSFSSWSGSGSGSIGEGCTLQGREEKEGEGGRERWRGREGSRRGKRGREGSRRDFKHNNYTVTHTYLALLRKS